MPNHKSVRNFVITAIVTMTIVGGSLVWPLTESRAVTATDTAQASIDYKNPEARKLARKLGLDERKGDEGRLVAASAEIEIEGERFIA